MYLLALYTVLAMVIVLVNYGYEFFTTKRYDNAGHASLIQMVACLIFIAVIKSRL